MRFRPANIRLINRRSNLPRLLLALSSLNGKSNDKKQHHECAGVDRSLHIRAYGVFSLPSLTTTTIQLRYGAIPGARPKKQGAPQSAPPVIG